MTDPSPIGAGAHLPELVIARMRECLRRLRFASKQGHHLPRADRVPVRSQAAPQAVRLHVGHAAALAEVGGLVTEMITDDLNATLGLIRSAGALPCSTGRRRGGALDETIFCRDQTRPALPGDAHWRPAVCAVAVTFSFGYGKRQPPKGNDITVR